MSADLNNTKNRHGGLISIDSTILFFGLLHACLNPMVIDRGFKTFLKHKERADLASNESLNSLLNAVFDIPKSKTA